MNNVDYKKKTIILSFICAFVVIALAMTIISFVQELKGDNEVYERHLYATVLDSGNNYVRVSEIDSDESYIFKTKDHFEVGDLLSIDYLEEGDDFTTQKIEVVAKKDELDNLQNEEPTTIPSTTPSVTTTTSEITTSKNTTTKKVTTTKKTTTKVTTAKDDEVVNYVRTEYEAYNNYEREKTIPEKAKSGFITLVDFIFYDGTIKGKKFSELKTSAKAKIIYYALLIDSKIDNKWPGYKDTIKNKVSDLKAKLIAKYMEITSSLCEKDSEACQVAKNDFAILKKSLSLTWNVIKDAAKYCYGEITSHLKTWYETWRAS